MTDRNIEWALFDIDSPETLSALLAGRDKNLGIAVMGSNGAKIIPIKVNDDGELVINLEASAITIGDVRIKDATGNFYVSVEAANTARTTATKVLATQNVDAAGNVMAAADLTAVKLAVEIMDD